MIVDRLPVRPRFRLPSSHVDALRRTRSPLIGWRTPPPIVPEIQAAAAYQAIGAVTVGGASDVVWPAHIANDYAILVVQQGRISSSTDPGVATLSTAADFTAVSGGSHLSQDVPGSRVTRVTLFEKHALGASEAAPQVADASGYTTTAYIITFRGAATSGSAVHVVSTGAGSGTAVTISGATTTVANAVVLAVVAAYGSNSVTISSYANADLASFTERLDSADGTRTHNSCATGDKATAGAYGNTTATLSSSMVWAGITVAIKPPTASGGGLLLLGVG